MLRRMRLDNPITVVKGVGEALSKRLEGLGIHSVQDLIYFFPRKYDDFSQITPIEKLRPGKVTLQAKVESVNGRYVKRRLHITEAVLADKTGKVRAVWFNQPYRADQLKIDEEYFFSGTFDFQRNRYVLSNPAAELA